AGSGASAASVALPPGRSILAPAAAARGSAALTTPRLSVGEAGIGVSDGEGTVAQAPSASGAKASRKRRDMPSVLFASHRVGNRSEAVAPHQHGQPAHDPPRDSGPFVDHRAVELDTAR